MTHCLRLTSVWRVVVVSTLIPSQLLQGDVKISLLYNNLFLVVKVQTVRLMMSIKLLMWNNCVKWWIFSCHNLYHRWFHYLYFHFCKYKLVWKSCFGYNLCIQAQSTDESTLGGPTETTRSTGDSTTSKRKNSTIKSYPISRCCCNETPSTAGRNQVYFYLHFIQKLFSKNFHAVYTPSTLNAIQFIHHKLAGLL